MREAIIRLSREGLVVVVPKSGSYVTPINIDQYLQACFIRVQLETGCIKCLAAMNMSLESLTRLRAVLYKDLRVHYQKKFGAAEKSKVLTFSSFCTKCINRL